MPDVPADPAAAVAPTGDIFSSYDPQGAMGGLFAPAFIRGYAPSEQAVANYYAPGSPGHRLSPDEINQTMMPELWRDPRPSTPVSYGGTIPYNLTYTGQGMVDPAALRAASQGGITYDMGARRDAIAARLAQNAALMQAAGFDPNDPSTQGTYYGKRRY